MRRAQDVGALGHEVHAAEHDELGVAGAARPARASLKRVAGVVGELDHLVALVVMAEDDERGRRASPWPRRCARPSRRRTGRGSARAAAGARRCCAFSYVGEERDVHVGRASRLQTLERHR